ncbi:MAG: hypothetical protein NC213_10315 [Acetobacter sp.]|nr:hypothetical protein [Bacteroides sp.]MCM1342128.1 hypothetical protein [Acetobacter sp.]MCM1434347.1 hypothetical protein [Clostridiales bacterium]
MRNRYELPNDIKNSVIWFIKGQVRREKNYKEAYSDILEGGGANYISKRDKEGNETERIYLPSVKGNNKSATEIKALALDALENSEETIKMRSVQQALSEIGNDIADDKLRENLRKSILLNINYRREFTYERLYLPNISKKKFYQYKSEFIFLVASKNNFIKKF